jgi:hypothetical protein
MDWGTIAGAAGASGGAAGVMRLLLAGWLRDRKSHEERVENTLTELLSDRDLLVQRVDRLEKDLEAAKDVDVKNATKLERKIDKLGAKLGNLTVALAARGVKVRLEQELRDDDADDED